jgi:hypothetical protein
MKFLSDLVNKDGFRKGKPSNDMAIVSAEDCLGVKFPTVYKLIIHEYGFLRWDGGHILGIDDGRYSVVKETMRERNREIPKGFKSFPKKSFMISKYPGGGCYVVDCQSGVVSLLTDCMSGSVEDSWPSIEQYIASELL